jgi:hypothetical protein
MTPSVKDNNSSPILVLKNKWSCLSSFNTIKYLGYIVRPDDQSHDPALVEAIVNFPKPKTIKGIRSFIDVFSF